jgi:cytidine deaminase
MALERAFEQRLLAEAHAARAASYSPYSGFAVGAAALAASGRVYRGTNVENASYGLTICAERVAVFTAITAGERAIEAIAIITAPPLVTPCGACRQVLWEVWSAHLRDEPTILLAADTGVEPQRWSLASLLPAAFDLPRRSGS